MYTPLSQLGGFTPKFTPISQLPKTLTEAAEKRKKEYTKSGTVSFYGGGEPLNKHTASGEVFDPNAMTAAMWDVPFGTRVRVTNTENNKSVIVTINDRGPAKRLNRPIDLSMGAFSKIADVNKGLINANVEILKEEEKKGYTSLSDLKYTPLSKLVPEEPKILATPREEVIKTAEPVRDDIWAKIGRIIFPKKAEIALGIYKEKELGTRDLMMKQEGDRLAYLRQKEFEETYRKEITEEPKIPEDYKEPTTFIGQFSEGMKAGYEGTIKPAVGYFIESMGIDLGSRQIREWGQKYADKTMIEFLKKPELLAPDDMQTYFKGGAVDPRWYGRMIGQTTPFIFAVIGSSVAGGLTAGPVGAAAGAYGSVYALEKGNSYKRYIDEGIPPDTATLYSNIYGTISAIVENAFGIKPAKIAEGVLAKSATDVAKKSFKNSLYNTIKKAGPKTLKVALEEGSEEVIQQFTENALSMWYDSEGKNLIEGLSEGFVAGFWASIPFGAAQVFLEQRIPAPPIGLTIKEVKDFGPPGEFRGFEDLSTRILEELKGKTAISPQYISDLTRRADMKQAEVEVINRILKEYKGVKKIPVAEFAEKVKMELLPITTYESIKDFIDEEGETFITAEKIEGRQATTRYRDYALPTEKRGDMESYWERIYESPIKTSAGDIHFPGQVDNYFAHTRIEDMNIPKDTRRIIELQSDLFQKGGLIREVPEGRAERFEAKKEDLARLQPYRNTWWQRIIREEIKRAAQDNKTTLLFPTGETAMTIEGLVGAGGEITWTVADTRPEFIDDVHANEGKLTPERLEVGLLINNIAEQQWIITEVLGDGKFKAVTVGKATEYGAYDEITGKFDMPERVPENLKETFDISGKIDTSNPIYKFYENDVQKYLKKIRPDTKRITDKQRVTWFKVPVIKADAIAPVIAFKQVKPKEKPKFTVDKKDAEQIFRKFFSEKEVEFLTIDWHKLPPGMRDKLGWYANQFVYLVENNGKVNNQAIYHEGFHAYMDLFIKPSDKRAVLDDIKQGKEMTNKKAEERLADEFANYVKTGKTLTERLKKFFQDILWFIKSLIRKQTRIKKVFGDVVARKRDEFREPKAEMKFKEIPDDEKKKIEQGILEGVIQDKSQGYSAEDIKLFSKIVRLMDTTFTSGDVDSIRASKYGEDFDIAVERVGEVQQRDVGDEEAVEIMREMPNIKDWRKALEVKETPEAQRLDQDWIDRISFFDNPPARRTPIAFALLGNKKTTVPMIRETFTEWVNDGVEVIVEPWAGAFTLGTHAIQDAIRAGLKEFHSNIFDKEKHMIVTAIRDGKIDQVQKSLDKAVKTLHNKIVEYSKFDPITKGAVEEFIKEYPDAWIGNEDWGRFMRRKTTTKIWSAKERAVSRINSRNAMIRTLKDYYESYAEMFQGAIDDLWAEGITDMDSAILISLIKRLGKYAQKGQDMVTKGTGTKIKTGLVYGNYGMSQAFNDIDAMFKLAKEKGTQVVIHSGDSEVMVKRFKDYNPDKMGWYLDPPYVNEAVKVYSREEGTAVAGESALEKFTHGDKLYESHKEIFESHNAGARTMWTNDLDQSKYLDPVDKQLKRTRYLAYRELQTPTSLVVDTKTFNIVKDFLSRERAITRISDEEYLEQRTEKFHGYTERFINSLIARGIKQEKIDQIKIDGKYIKNLVKVKREKTGRVSAVISKNALDYIKKTNQIKNLDERWIKKMSAKNLKLETANVMQGYETGARFFRRIGEGFKRLIFDPIRHGERLAAERQDHLRNVELKSYRKLNKRQARQLFQYAAFKQNKPVQPITWDELHPKVKKAYTDFRRISERLYPEVKDASDLRGREIGKVENYFPLYTRQDLKLLDEGLFEWTRKDPYFASIHERLEEVPIELYETDARKTIDHWITGVSRYLDIGKRTVQVKYLIDSEEFVEIAGAKNANRIREWYRYLVNPPKVEGAWKGLRFLRNLQATAILGFRDTVVFKQFINLIDFWVATRANKLAKGSIKVMRKSQLAKIAKKSGSVLERSAGLTIQDLKNGVVRFMRKPTEWADRLTAKIGMVSILDQMIDRHLKEGKTLTANDFKNFKRRAQDIIDHVMGAMSKAETPKYFRTELGKNINMFFSQLNSKMQWYVSDVFSKRWKFLKEMSGSNRRLFTRAIVALIIGGYIEHIINSMSFGDDPEDIAVNISKTIAGNFPMVGSIVFALTTGQPYSPMPLLGNTIQLMQNVAEGRAGDAVWTGTTFFGMPQQVKRTVQGVQVVGAGRVTDKKGQTMFRVETWDEIIRTIMRGKWGSRAARQYFKKKEQPKKEGGLMF